MSRNPGRPEWQLHARCRGLPTDIFFAAANDKGSRRSAHEAAAKQICQVCPVRRRCLAYAMETNEQHGIWGATTPGERSALRRHAVRGA